MVCVHVCGVVCGGCMCVWSMCGVCVGCGMYVCICLWGVYMCGVCVCGGCMCGVCVCVWYVVCGGEGRVLCMGVVCVSVHAHLYGQTQGNAGGDLTQGLLLRKCSSTQICHRQLLRLKMKLLSHHILLTINKQFLSVL